jgi:choline dehydrogenase
MTATEEPRSEAARPFSTLTSVPDMRATVGASSAMKRPKGVFDYIIVGGGSAGCALASRLAIETDASVLLLEAGGDDDIESIHTPQRWVESLETRACRFYETEPQPFTAGRKHMWPRGRVIGGSSALNVSIFVRGHRADFDSWAYQGARGWDYASLLPLFKAMEDFEGGASAFRGTGGPLHVSTPRPGRRHPGAVAFEEATSAMGYPSTPDLNGASMEGTGWTDLTVREGRRQSSAVAFLRPALRRPNLTVVTEAPALSLVVEKGRCKGVRYLHGGTPHLVHAAREVIVSSGSLESPRILMLSGIGDAAELSALGIAPVADLPGVGRNLQDHLLVGGIVYEGRGPQPASNYNHSEVYLWARSEPGLFTPDIFIHHHSRVFAVPETLPVENGYTIIPGLARAHSRGSIRLRSADPNDALIIDPRYLTSAQDRKALLAAVKISRDIGASAPYGAMRLKEVLPGPSVKTDAELEEFTARAVHTFFHPTSTCRMGYAPDCVVDAELKVHGIDGLRVADASVMPSNTCANTNAPSMLIGWKCAELILAGIGAAATPQ